MSMIVDRSSRGRIRIRGTEAAEFLQGQVTNDVEALEPGQGCYAALLNHKGKLRLGGDRLGRRKRARDQRQPAEKVSTGQHQV